MSECAGSAFGQSPGRPQGVVGDRFMGRKDALGCIEKREILNQPAASTETLKYWGDWFFEKAHFSDAIDFYAKIND